MKPLTLTEKTCYNCKAMEERFERRDRGESSGPGNYSVEVMLRRFFRDVQQSEIMTEIKKRRFFEKKASRNKRRAVAQVRAVRRKTKRGY